MERTIFNVKEFNKSMNKFRQFEKFLKRMKELIIIYLNKCLMKVLWKLKWKRC